MLRKVLPEGRLQRIPRNPLHRDIVLGLLCLDLRRRLPYGEIELNDILKAGLAKLSARVDHVTARRYLVDCGFVKRDRAGARYFLNYPKLESTLSSEARSTAAEILAGVLTDIAEAARERERRRAANRRPAGPMADSEINE